MSARFHLSQMWQHGRELVASAVTSRRSAAPANPFDVFLTEDARAINRARQEHLASLGLDFRNKRVLEVGAGIGLHTQFFVDRGCGVVVTDGNAQNVEEIKRRYPKLRVEQADLDGPTDLRRFGSFELVYCYGLLYHLAEPERAIRRMAEICTGQLLLETCVSLGAHPEVVFLRDFASNNQATGGVGCRPTRSWVMRVLRGYFGHAYHTLTQPDHPDFPTDWDLPETRLLHRAVFVGSRQPITVPTLTTDIPRKQERHQRRAA